MDILELMNYNYDLGCNGKDNFESQLGKIQVMIAETFIKTPHTKEEIASFEANLYGNSQMFGKHAASYASVDMVYPAWDKLKEQVIIKNYEENKTK